MVLGNKQVVLVPASPLRSQRPLFAHEPPDWVYYIDSGSVNALDESGKLITTLTAGNVFGEMAYFSRKKRRNATVVANSDVVVRKISGEKFDTLPIVKKIFRKIANKRSRQV